MQNGALRRDSKANEIGLHRCFINTAKTCIYVIAAMSAVISAFHLSCREIVVMFIGLRLNESALMQTSYLHVLVSLSSVPD